MLRRPPWALPSAASGAGPAELCPALAGAVVSCQLPPAASESAAEGAAEGAPEGATAVALPAVGDWIADLALLLSPWPGRPCASLATPAPTPAPAPAPAPAPYGPGAPVPRGGWPGAAGSTHAPAPAPSPYGRSAGPGYGGPAGPAPAPSGYGASSPYGAPAAPSGYGAPAAAALGAGFGSFYGSSGGGAYGAPAGIGGFGAPAPRPPVPAAAPSAPYGGPAFGLPGAGAGPASILPYGGAAPSAHAPHSRSQGSAGALAALLPTGGAHAPARSSGSSGASSAPKALPWFWDKKTDASSGRTYYVNHITHTTAWTLPTEDTYHVDIVAPGPLGVSLERCYHGMTRFAGPSGRRNSGADTGAVVKSVEPGSAIDRASSGRVQMGHHLIAVNGASTLTWDLSATCSMIQRASRPVRLTFQDPYAV
mmetsp:Transcript_24498/g.92560  ORF Transcript_24498/g.92560 Transcript_24498/m.92560 type:complete len:423 (-) Transcript_24498:266-1534(-)